MVGQSETGKKKNTLLIEQNLNFDSKQFSRKQNVSPDNVYLLTPRDLYVWHKLLFCHPSAISLLPLPLFAITCNLKSKTELVFTVFVSVNTLTDLSGNILFLQPVQKVEYKVTSVGCNWLIFMARGGLRTWKGWGCSSSSLGCKFPVLVLLRVFWEDMLKNYIFSICFIYSIHQIKD